LENLLVPGDCILVGLVFKKEMRNEAKDEREEKSLIAKKL
jgi:hypothetical protein